MVSMAWAGEHRKHITFWTLDVSDLSRLLILVPYSSVLFLAWDECIDAVAKVSISQALIRFADGEASV